MAVVYAAVASLGVVAPLAIALLSGERSNSVISSMRSWLTAFSNVIMAVIFVLLGVNFVSKGLAVLG